VDKKLAWYAEQGRITDLRTQAACLTKHPQEFIIIPFKTKVKLKLHRNVTTTAD